MCGMCIKLDVGGQRLEPIGFLLQYKWNFYNKPLHNDKQMCSFSLCFQRKQTRGHTEIKNRASVPECVSSADQILTDPSGGQRTSAEANTADPPAISITDSGTPRSPCSSMYSTTSRPQRASLCLQCVRVCYVEYEERLKRPDRILRVKRQHLLTHPKKQTTLRGEYARKLVLTANSPGQSGEPSGGMTAGSAETHTEHKPGV